LNNDSGAGATTNTNNQSTGLTSIGAFTFSRRSTVSLSGTTWGELRLGRDYAPVYWGAGLYDVFGNVGVGSTFNMIGALSTASGVQTNVRVSNSIGWLTPNTLGGFYGQLMRAFGENPSNAPGGTQHDGDHTGARIGYAQGAVDVSASYGRTTLASGDWVSSNVAGSYTTPAFTVMGGIYREEIRTAAVRRASSWSLGGQVPVGAGLIKAQYTATSQNAAAGDNDGHLLAVGYVYNFSKRTAAYTTYARITNKGASKLYNMGRAPGTPGGAATGFDIGLRHAF
jgi:predicted porin